MDSSNLSELAERLKPAVRVLQIIVLAMALAVATFAGFAIHSNVTGPGLANPSGVFLPVAIGGDVLAVVGGRVACNLFANKARRRVAAGQVDLPGNTADGNEPPALKELGGATRLLFMAYQNMTITSAALLEAASFMSIIAYLIDGELAGLGLAAVLVALLIGKCPTAGRVAEWICDQQRQAAEEKLLVN